MCHSEKAKHAAQRRKSSSACAPGISVISPRETLGRTPEEATVVPGDWEEKRLDRRGKCLQAPPFRLPQDKHYRLTGHTDS